MVNLRVYEELKTFKLFKSLKPPPLFSPASRGRIMEGN
jgi:hypothetical protein